MGRRATEIDRGLNGNRLPVFRDLGVALLEMDESKDKFISDLGGALLGMDESKDKFMKMTMTVWMMTYEDNIR